jgi:hypothetical protein
MEAQSYSPPHAQRCRKSGRADAKAAATEVGLAHS